MTALTSDRNTAEALGDNRTGDVAAAAMIFVGAIVMRNASGFLTQGATATGSVGVGRAKHRSDNSAGADGAAKVDYRPGTFLYANSAGADEITAADSGKPCFIVDDQTVAKTNGTNTRSPAGIVDGVDPSGVWVRFDEALTIAATT